MISEKKLKDKFEREFVNGTFIKPFKDYPFLADKIQKVMRDMYDLGHSEGMADMLRSSMESYSRGRHDGMADTCAIF